MITANAITDGVGNILYDGELNATFKPIGKEYLNEPYQYEIPSLVVSKWCTLSEAMNSGNSKVSSIASYLHYRSNGSLNRMVLVCSGNQIVMGDTVYFIKRKYAVVSTPLQGGSEGLMRNYFNVTLSKELMVRVPEFYRDILNMNIVSNRLVERRLNVREINKVEDLRLVHKDIDDALKVLVAMSREYLLKAIEEITWSGPSWKAVVRKLDEVIKSEIVIPSSSITTHQLPYCYRLLQYFQFKTGYNKSYLVRHIRALRDDWKNHPVDVGTGLIRLNFK